MPQLPIQKLASKTRSLRLLLEINCTDQRTVGKSVGWEVVRLSVLFELYRALQYAAMYFQEDSDSTCFLDCLCYHRQRLSSWIWRLVHTHFLSCYLLWDLQDCACPGCAPLSVLMYPAALAGTVGPAVSVKLEVKVSWRSRPASNTLFTALVNIVTVALRPDVIVSTSSHNVQQVWDCNSMTTWHAFPSFKQHENAKDFWHTCYWGNCQECYLYCLPVCHCLMQLFDLQSQWQDHSRRFVVLSPFGRHLYLCQSPHLQHPMRLLCIFRFTDHLTDAWRNKTPQNWKPPCMQCATHARGFSGVTLLLSAVCLNVPSAVMRSVSCIELTPLRLVPAFVHSIVHSW